MFVSYVVKKYKKLYRKVTDNPIDKYNKEKFTLFRGEDMFIKSGDVVFLGHYSKPFRDKSIVVDTYRDISNDIISVKVSNEFLEGNILIDDPVVLGFERENRVYLTSCNIVGVVASDFLINISVNNEEFIVNTRAHERYPVSLNVDVIRALTEEHSVAIAKNISYEGLMIQSKYEFDEGENANIIMKLNDIEVKVGAKIVWKMSRDMNFEYGIKITFMDYNYQKVLWEYIDKLKDEQDEFIRTFKNNG